MSTSPESSCNAGTRICGLTARYSGFLLRPPCFSRCIGIISLLRPLRLSAIGTPADKSALLELRHRARDLGLVHMGLGAHRLSGHHAVLAEGDQDPPFRYSNTVAAVDARERLRDQAGQNIEPVGQKIFELEQRRIGSRRGGLRRAVTHWTGVHHRPRPAAERWASASTAAANIGRRSQAAQRSTTRGPVVGSVTRAGVIGAAASRRQRGAALAQALDGDELVAGGGAGGRWHRAGDLLALDLAKRRRFLVVAGLAIGGGHGRAAARAAGETAVDAVAVGIVGDDERTLFGLRRSAANGSREDERGEQIPHP